MKQVTIVFCGKIYGGGKQVIHTDFLFFISLQKNTPRYYIYFSALNVNLVFDKELILESVFQGELHNKHKILSFKQ